MKPLIFTLLLLCGAAHAQTLEWTDVSPALWGHSERDDWDTHGFFKNNSTEWVNATLHELNRNFMPGDYVSVCWTSCYIVDDPNREYPEALLAPQTGMTSFTLHFIPGQSLGERTICFGVTNDQDSDTLKTCYTFKVTPAGVTGSIATPAFALAPNPASETVRLTNAPAGARLTVYDLTGRALLTTAAAEVDVRSLTPGVYVCALEVEGRRVETKRLVVAH